MRIPIRVLSLLDALHFGGDENRVLQLAQTIDRSRFDFRVATLRARDPDFEEHFGSLRRQFEDADIELIELGERRRTRQLSSNDPRRHVLRVGTLVQTVARLSGYIRKERIQLIDGHGGTGYLCGTIAAAARGLPTVVTTYNVREAWSPRQLWYAAHQWTLATASAIVTDSHAVASELRKWMVKARDDKIYIVPNGPYQPRATSTEDAVRSTLGLRGRNDTRVVAQIATLLPGKGQHILLEAAPLVLARHPDVTILLVGFERPDHLGYSQFLGRRAAELGIADRVIVASYPGPIGDVWQVVDVHAHPTMLDSLPNVILEGMSLGKPLVTTAIRGIPDLVVDGETGRVVPPNDPIAIAEALSALLEDPSMASDFGAAARRRYADHYTPHHLANSMESIFEHLVDSAVAG